MDYSAVLAKKLLQIKAIRLQPDNPFTWASGLLSPIYCDNRITLSFPEVRTLIKSAFCEVIKQEKINCIVGVATAGIPHGALIADELNLPFAYVRSKAKAHGRQNRVEGQINKNDKVALVEDLISTGGSSISVLRHLRESGFKADKIYAIFSYGLEIASNNFEEANASYHAITSFEVLAKEALATDYISKDEFAQLIEWQKDPKQWSDSRSTK